MNYPTHGSGGSHTEDIKYEHTFVADIHFDYRVAIEAIKTVFIKSDKSWKHRRQREIREVVNALKTTRIYRKDS